MPQSWSEGRLGICRSSMLNFGLNSNLKLLRDVDFYRSYTYIPIVTRHNRFQEVTTAVRMGYTRPRNGVKMGDATGRARRSKCAGLWPLSRVFWL